MWLKHLAEAALPRANWRTLLVAGVMIISQLCTDSEAHCDVLSPPTSLNIIARATGQKRLRVEHTLSSPRPNRCAYSVVHSRRFKGGRPGWSGSKLSRRKWLLTRPFSMTTTRQSRLETAALHHIAWRQAFRQIPW
ncbi:hypothetical protein IWZ03DRAFT_243440 [Phyllosticta citriasiana]|uniref:Secreted protein n=1 Tax=Phyllosticta citriasiana TaxID=595635 RepID=A0ABR1KKZ3_9PEZI